MVYVGLSYYGPALGSDEYLSFLLSALVEVPSYLVCWLLMDKCGRRWPLSIAMCISGITSLFTVLLPEGQGWAKFILNNKYKITNKLRDYILLDSYDHH